MVQVGKSLKYVHYIGKEKKGGSCALCGRVLVSHIRLQRWLPSYYNNGLNSRCVATSYVILMTFGKKAEKSW